MPMLLLPLLALALPCPAPDAGGAASWRAKEPARQEEEREEIDMRRMFELVKRLEDGLESGTVEERMALLGEARTLPHDEVAGAVKPYALVEELEVRLVALDVLRWMEVPGALDELHGLFRRSPFPKNDEWNEALVKGIGQHAAKESIELLAELPKSYRNEKTVRAQVMALGRIRHRLAVQALIQLMPRFGKHRDAYIGDFRLCLVGLTGLDKGQDPLEWIAWWEEEKLSFRVPKELSLPAPQMKKWLRYWDLDDESGERRGE